MIFQGSLHFKLVDDIGDACHDLFRKQYIQLMILFIYFCLKSHDRYYFNILRMITLLYHFYIEYEIYHTAYNKVINLLNGHVLVERTMSTWDDYIIF